MKTHARRYYERLYRHGAGNKPPVLGGKPLAVELGYSRRALDTVPGELWDDFLPCGNPLPHVRPAPGEMVLNLGCGAGVDSLALIAERGGGFGIVNLDVVYPVLAKGLRSARRLIPDHPPDWVCADGETLPFSGGSFSWVILNGVFNLFENKAALAKELRRVLRPGGRIAGADLCRTGPLPGYFRDEPDAWAWCMSGSLTEDELTAVFNGAGFGKLEYLPDKLDELFDRAVFVFEAVSPYAPQPS